MSDRERPQIIMTAEQAGAKQLAEEMAAIRDTPLDEAKVPGGVFQRADGTLQNAHGQPVDEKGRVVGDAPPAETNAPAAEASARSRKR
jgi:hypothetical protein